MSKSWDKFLFIAPRLQKITDNQYNRQFIYFYGMKGNRYKIRNEIRQIQNQWKVLSYQMRHYCLFYM